MHPASTGTRYTSSPSPESGFAPAAAALSSWTPRAPAGELSAERLIVADVASGRRVRNALRLPEPRVCVETTKRSAAA